MRLFNDEEEVIDSTNKNRAPQCTNTDAESELPDGEVLPDTEVKMESEVEAQAEAQAIKDEEDEKDDVVNL